MDQTPELTSLLRFARWQLRLRRARHWMMWTSFACAAVAIGATLVDQPYLGLFLLPLVPLAGVIGYLCRGAGDQVLAQLLDQQLRSQELLASGLACKEKPDEASQMITAQAESAAGAVDRATLKEDDKVKRSEAAAGLVLAIAVTVCIGHPRSNGLVSESSQSVERNLSVPRTESARSNLNRLEGLSSHTGSEPRASRSADPQDAVNDSTGQSRETPSARSRDASGDGIASTALNRPTAPPAARASDSTSSTLHNVRSGTGESTTTSISSAATTDAAFVPRKPLAIESTSPPDLVARDRVRVALKGEQIGMESRDLVRAYFDLDEPR